MEALSFLLIPIVISGGLLMAKALDQRARDSRREHYTLVFPRDMDMDQVMTWLNNIYGALSNNGLTGTPTVVLEVWSTPEGITHRLKVPAGRSDSIVNQLRSSIPGTSVIEDKDRAHRLWTRSVEVGLHNDFRPLSIPAKPEVLSTSLLANLGSLRAGETVMMQWVITAAPSHRLPLQKEARTNELRPKHVIRGDEADRDEVNDRRKKLSETNVHAVLRVAATADTKQRADYLVNRIRDALASTQTATTFFKKRMVHPKDIQERIDRAAGLPFWPIRLGISELAPLLAWPAGSPFVAGLAASRAKPLPASTSIPLEGRKLGVANMQGHERVLALSYPNALRHKYVVGPTGVGKTTFLTNSAIQDMERGHGVIIIDSKGDHVDEVITRIPDKRVDDVIYVDTLDTEYPVGFNLFDQGNSRAGIDQLSFLIGQLYKDTSQSVNAPMVLYYMTHALAETAGSTFVDLPILMAPAGRGTPEQLWRDDLCRGLRNADIRNWLRGYIDSSPKDQDMQSLPLYRRIWQFTVRREIKLMLGQRTSSFKMTDVIRDNKILLIKLNRKRIGTQSAALIATLLTGAVWQAVNEVTPARENFLYLDEFQDIAKLAIDIDELLAQARSKGLGAVLAHQYLTQLPADLRPGVMANTGTKVAFQANDKSDAMLLAGVFGEPVTHHDVKNLARHEAITIIMTDKGVSPPVTMKTFDYPPKTKNEERIRALSRKLYGRPLEDVELGFRPPLVSDSQGPKRPPRPTFEGFGGI